MRKRESPPSPAPARSSLSPGAEIDLEGGAERLYFVNTVRGREAMQMLKAADPANKPPKDGFEYLLARIRFQLQGRAVSDIGVFVLGDSPFQWEAYSANFDQYDKVAVTPPDPVLKGPVKSGETREGWVAFAVPKSEKQPIMTFDPSSGGATGRGNILFFKLYK